MRRIALSTLLLAAACSQDGGSPTGVGPQAVLPGAPIAPVAPVVDAGGSAAPGAPLGGGTAADAGSVTINPGSSTGDASLATGDAQAPLASNVITYQKHIRPLLVGNCVECHTKGGIGPTDLSDWMVVKSIAPLIASVVAQGRMPPWPADEKCHDIAESRALSADAKNLFAQWQTGGFQEGNQADYVAPPPRHREDLGQPNLVMKATESFTPAQNSDTYRCFYLGTVPSDTYVTALDLIPGNRAEVHHIQLHRVEPADAAGIESTDRSSPGGGYDCGQGLTTSQNMFSYRPGALAVVLNQGDAVYFKGGSGLLLQIHYNTQFLPPGTGPGPDQSSVAMWTLPAGEHPEHVVYRTGAMAPLNGDGATNPLAFFSASIPANATNVVGQDTVSMGELSTIGTTFLKGEIVGMTPHAHSWATRMVASLKGSGGDKCLIDVPDWDFNWQLDYMYKTGVPYTENDTVHIECDYDNTAENQPVINGARTPVMPITFGEKTLNEMCLHYIWLRFPYADFAAANR